MKADALKYFDSVAAEWDSREVMSVPKRIIGILDKMQIEPGMSVLDLGTGTGVLVPYILMRIGKRGRLRAVDASTAMLFQAERKYAHLTSYQIFEHRDVEVSPDTRQYDRIIMYCVYPHLENPEMCVERMVSRNLKIKGRLYIAFPANADYINQIHQRNHMNNNYLPTPHELVKCFCRRGLKAQVVSDSLSEYIVCVNR